MPRLRGQTAQETVIPTLERISGVKFDIDRLRSPHARIGQAEEDLVKVLQSAKNRPADRRLLRRGVLHRPHLHRLPRHARATQYYATLRAEDRGRMRLGKGPVTPDGDMGEEKYRLIVEGPPNWTSFRDFWKMFYDEGAVVVSSTYAKVGGLYDFGFRHDPDHPLDRSPSTAWAATPT